MSGFRRVDGERVVCLMSDVPILCTPTFADERMEANFRDTVRVRHFCTERGQILAEVVLWDAPDGDLVMALALPDLGPRQTPEITALQQAVRRAVDAALVGRDEGNLS